MSLRVYYEVLNQRGTPALFTDTLANRPAFGFQGRLFFSTDTGQIFEDTGTAWTVIADAGAGTTGTLQQVTTNGNTTTLGITVQGININDGAGTGANNVAIGNNALNVNTTGSANTALGYVSLNVNTTGIQNTGVGYNSLFSNTIGNQNTAIGTSALSSNISGSNNTGIGQGALQSNTTGSNTAVGSAALSNNTTGTSNTAIGISALSFNTTANNNTAIGYQSLLFNTTGTQNTAIGNVSLSANTTGSDNTAVGFSSLNANTIGQNNAALGRSSLGSNTTGAGNTAVGYNSSALNTTGSNNTSIGNSALNLNTTANNNTAIGVSSLSANTTGDSNTAIGINAGVNNTIGTNNTFIGLNSGTGITTGSNNTIIGNASTLSSTLSNNIILADGSGNIRYRWDGSNNVFGGNIITPQVRASTSAGLSINANSGTQVADFGAGGSANITFYGGLSGTSATFSGQVTSDDLILTAGTLFGAGNTGFSNRLSDTTLYLQMPATGFNITDNALNTRFILSSAGAATFSGSVGTTAMNMNNMVSLGSIGGGAIYLPYTAGLFFRSADGSTAKGKIQADNSSNLLLNSDNNANVYIGTTTQLQSTERLAISSSSNTAMIAQFTGGATNGWCSKFWNTDTTGNNLFIEFLTENSITSRGSITYNRAAGLTLYNTSSDYRLKSEINDFNALDIINNLKPKEFRIGKAENKSIGFIAHELQQYLPQAVSGKKDDIDKNGNPKYQSVDYSQLTGLLTKAIQELKAEIDALKNN